MNKRTIKRIAGVIACILFCVVTVYVYVDSEYVFWDKKDTKKVIGIIDGRLTHKSEIITITNNEINRQNKNDEDREHGDLIVEFIEKASDAKVAYYDASDADGKISTDSIIEGLNWMKENNIEYVNISLSGSKYSDDLQEWFNENQQIHVYASYNNVSNTFDYPAMYQNVIASGNNKDVMHKENDVYYKANKVVIEKKYGNLMKEIHF